MQCSAKITTYFKDAVVTLTLALHENYMHVYIYIQDLILSSHEQMFTDSTSNQIDTGTASHIYTHYLNI